MSKITKEVIVNFLEGHNPLKYVVAIECNQATNIASLVISDPNIGKSVINKTYKPFIYLTQKVGSSLYNGDKGKIREAMNRFNVKFRVLRTTNDLGVEPERMANGYKYIAETTGSYFDLITFFKNGGCNPNQRENPNRPDQYPWNKEFVTCKPEEQFMIQTGIRLFKGFEDYNDLHRFQFDLETTGLNPTKEKIFQIGIRDNRFYLNNNNEKTPFEFVLETKGEGSKELRESERRNIRTFAQILKERRPDIISGYNSEDFDWPFIEERCRILSLDFKALFNGLNGSSIRREKAKLKLGSDSIDYLQTKMWGTNVLDISHAVRKTMAINSEIKSWSLKWITQYSKIAKKNRVYVPGNLIHTIWNDELNTYYFNNEDGDWFKFIDDDNDLNYTNNIVKIHSGNYKKVTGAYIVQRYLMDDLWETEMVDGIYNQASFLMAKIIPTGFMRSSTMGTAGIWQLIMLAWSYEQNLGVPLGQPAQTFVGGLSRLCEVGYRRNVVKLDYAALYPNTEITHNIFPEHDISGVMKGLLVYIAETRDEYKGLKGDYEKKAKEIKKVLDVCENETEKKRLNELYTEYSFLASNYDKKQLPIKILANSFFGSFGAPHVFNWGDINCAEETTCRGRQYLRLMVSHFTKFGFIPLVADTDGMNFAIPEDIDKYEYLCVGNHRFTEKLKGQTLTGLKAVVSEFNDKYMIGRMGLDIDDICASTINFARKNYANDIIKGDVSKVKLVGNTIKSNKMPKYIEEFFKEGIRYLLDDEGDKFVELYYKTVDDIVNYNIPLSKIASKSRIRITNEGYKEKCLTKNKAGNPMPKQAHMELVLRHELKTNIGDTIYYINTGTKKSDGDLKTIKNDDGSSTIILNCKLLNAEDVENNPDATTSEYNAKKYLDMFNTRIAKLMVCFNKDVRDRILIDYEKSKEVFTINENGRKVYEEVLQERTYFTKDELKLCHGIPLEEGDQDDVNLDIMLFEDREVEFWKKVNKTPNNITEEFWNDFLKKYEIRKEKEHQYNIFKSKCEIINILMYLTPEDFKNFYTKFPKIINASFGLEVDSETSTGYLVAHGERIVDYSKLTQFSYISETIHEWLEANPKKKIKNWVDKYEHTIDKKDIFMKLFNEEYFDDKYEKPKREFVEYEMI